MNSVTADGFRKAERIRGIFESIIPTAFLVAYFGGAVLAGVLSSVVEVKEASQFFYLFIASALAVGTLWWWVHEIPKREWAMNELKSLLPNTPVVFSVRPRQAFRLAEAFVTDERQKITTLLKNRLRNLNVEQHSGLFLEGGRFEMYHGKPTDRVTAIKAEVELVNHELGLSLQPSFVRGQRICVHIPVLGEHLYFG